MFRHWIVGVSIALTSVAAAQDSNRAPAFPEIYNSEPELAELLSPQEALEKLQLSEGFKSTLFAAEPEVQNPIAAATDSRGRLWVAENYTYAERSQRFDLNLNDRVVVLEDEDGDGKADRRVVFTDSVKMLTGITTGRGGVWLMCPPQLLYIPDADGDLIPDGPAEVKLDGFHVARENYHNFANGLSWGPDGWLYGRCGASCPGEMGLPGESDDARVPIRGGMWRYHPERQVVEALTHGTTNPWGHDWNEVGDLFFINTVNGHLWHAIPGAHFVRPHTIDANPYIYELIDMHADHWHFDTGQSWTKSRDGAANDYGGGHAHVGMMIYQGQQWPEAYRGKLMTINMHGRRINTERLDREGSGYVARHEPDFLLSDDIWFRGMDLLPQADGSVLLIDWSDTGECHDHSGVHRTSGRIFKIAFDEDSGEKNSEEGLHEFSNEALAQLQIVGTDWQSRRAREMLRTLKLNRGNVSRAAAILRAGLDSPIPRVSRLRCLWSLFQLEAIDEEKLVTLLSDSDAYVRLWAVRLLSDDWRIDHSDGGQPARPNFPSIELHQRLCEMASSETDAPVRLALASVLQRLPLDKRPELASSLFRHRSDAADHNLPLMIWYGLTPLGEKHLNDLVELVYDCHWPSVRQLMTRRIAEQIDERPEATARILTAAMHENAERKSDIVLGMATALAGKRQVAVPDGWPEFIEPLAENEKTHSAIQQLNVLFGDGRAVEELKQIAADGRQSLEVRMAALQSLSSSRDEDVQKLRLKLLGQRYLNTVAAEGLASSTDPNVGEELVKRYRSFAGLDRPKVVSILASRVPWAKSLLHAVRDGKIDRDEISPFGARQLSNLNDTQIDELLVKHWGQVRESSGERKQQIAELRSYLTPETLAEADLNLGRQLFDKNCAVCHTMFGVGGKLGPDLTGAQRSNMDYLLENIVDPSAVVTNEFRATIVRLADERVYTGLVTSRTDQALTLATQNEVFQIPVDEIVQTRQSTASTMPDGLLGQLNQSEIRDLFAYLRSKQQVNP